MKISRRSAKILIPLVAISFATAMAPALADSSNGDGQKSGVIYNSVISPLPGNLVSQAFEAQQVSEFGNAVNFSAGKNHVLSKVVVTMSSWACESGSGSTGNCVTSENASFSHPITLNIYGPSSNDTLPGALIASVTKFFDIKFRPSSSTQCTEGRWYDVRTSTCFRGLAQNITFNLKNVKVGSSAIFGIAYNTTHFGYAPVGQSAACLSSSGGCGYDSLNVALTADPTNVNVGSSVVPGKLWLNSLSHSAYADGWGSDGQPLANPTNTVGSFRIDSPIVASWWGTVGPNYDVAPWYVPAIEVFANGEGKGDNQSDEKSPNSKVPDNKSDAKPGIKKD